MGDGDGVDDDDEGWVISRKPDTHELFLDPDDEDCYCMDVQGTM
jgi:hypothetical protein